MFFIINSIALTFYSLEGVKKDRAERLADGCLFLTRLLLNKSKTDPSNKEVSPLSTHRWYLLFQVGLCAGLPIIISLTVVGIFFRSLSSSYQEKMGEKMGNLGDACKEDPQYYMRAFSLYKSAASLGNRKAMKELAFCYYTGLVTPIDHKKAVEWYQKASQKGCEESMHFLGFFYEYGIGVKKDEEEAVKWYEKGAKAGCTASTNWLIDEYQQKGNQDRAAYWKAKLPS